MSYISPFFSAPFRAYRTSQMPKIQPPAFLSPFKSVFLGFAIATSSKMGMDRFTRSNARQMPIPRAFSTNAGNDNFSLLNSNTTKVQSSSEPLSEKAKSERIRAQYIKSQIKKAHAYQSHMPKKPIKQRKLEEIFSKEEIEKYEALLKEMMSIPVVKLSPEKINALVEKNYGDGAPRKERILHLVIGPPGSGKSSILVNPLTKRDGALIIDSDFIKPQIEGYDKGRGSFSVHPVSAEIASKLLVKALEKGDNIVHPTTGWSDLYVRDLLLAAKKEGYHVGLHLTDLPTALAAKRVLKRAEKEEAGIRQVVDLHYTLNVVGDLPKIVFKRFTRRNVKLVDEYIHVDNNVAQGDPPKIVKRSPKSIADKLPKTFKLDPEIIRNLVKEPDSKPPENK